MQYDTRPLFSSPIDPYFPDDFIGGRDGLSFTVDPDNGGVSRVLGVTRWLQEGEGNNTYVVGEGDNIGEIDYSHQLTFYSDFFVWDDLLPPFVDYNEFLFGGIIQEYLGYIDVSTRLYARSSNGDEQIACFGRKSPLDSFRSDSLCGEGAFKLSAIVSNNLPPYTFTVNPAVVSVPEPSELLLFAVGLAAAATSARQRKRIPQ